MLIGILVGYGTALGMIIIATLPLFIVLPFNDKIDTLSNNTLFVGIAFLITGVILYLSDRLPQGRKSAGSMLDRALKLTKASTDEGGAAAPAWAEQACANLSACRIAEYRPNDALTRADCAVMLYNAMRRSFAGRGARDRRPARARRTGGAFRARKPRQRGTAPRAAAGGGG